VGGLIWWENRNNRTAKGKGHNGCK
jgi:hypothetical protein